MDFINLYLINEKLPAMKKNLLLLNILLLIALTTFAQNGFVIDTIPSSLQSGRHCLKIDPSGNKWIGFTGKGAAKFDGINWTNYDTLNSGIAANYVNDIAFGPLNIIWFATRKGLSRFDGNSWTTYKTSNSGLPNDTVTALFVDNSIVWIGTSNGFAKFDGNTWVSYSVSNSGLINNNITCINKDQSNTIWVGTVAGLTTLSGTSWISYNENNSNFVRDQVNALFYDNGSIWIGTKNSGMYKFYNNIFYPLQSLFFNVDLSVLSLVHTISKGPQGGILVNSFIEIFPTQIHRYTIPTGFSFPYFHAYDPIAGLVWYMQLSAPPAFNFIYSFNYQNYIGNTQILEIIGQNVLDVNQVQAAIKNTGNINNAYEIPKRSGKIADGGSSFWVGGKDNVGQLHIAGNGLINGEVDYRPGPLDTISGTIDSITSATFNKVWKIDRLNIEEFKTAFANGGVQNGTYFVSPDIISWPAIGTGNYMHNMAPFVDVNVDGLYKPLIDGDYPKITGDQMCYWIFNDNHSPNSQTMDSALNIEVHASAYAYTCPQIDDSLKVLNYTTFYNFEIYNRSSNNYTNTYIGNWDVSSLGFGLGDYAGCNPDNNYGFFYNSDSIDGYGELGAYGEKPPMISTVVLNGPLAESNDTIDNNNNGVIDEAGEKNLMTNFLCFNIDWRIEAIIYYYQFTNIYNAMQSKWYNGAHLTYGGDGTSGIIPTDFMFDGIPTVNGWDEFGNANDPYSQSFIMGSGPFNLNAGQHVNYSYALVWTRDLVSTYTLGNLYNKNLADVKKVQQWYAADNYPSCYDLQAGVNSIPKNNNSFTLYPNPANTQITIAYKAQTKNARIEIFNATGQKVNSFVYFNQVQTIDISDFADGLYLIKITDGKNSSVQRFVKN